MLLLVDVLHQMMKAPELLALEADLSDSSRVPEEELTR